MEEGANQTKAETTKGSPTNTTSSTDKMSQTHEEEHLEEGGAITLDQTDKTTPSSADTVANSATMRQSVKRRRVSWPPQADNPLTTPQTLTTMTVAECS